MIVVLFRHGIAQDRDAPDSPPDAERRLTSRGIRRTHQAARGLARLELEPQAVLSSPYARARETADIALEELRLEGRDVVLTDALLPEAPPADLLRVVERLDVGCVLCTGHAPHLDRLIAHVLGTNAPVTELKKAGAACLDLGPPVRLEWLHGASTLRRLGRS
jgi:phosphohistidine phosphatase